MTDFVVVGSFALFLLLFTGIGAASSRFRTESAEDYLVASRSVRPWLIALSAVSSNNSGYMFIGLIGFAWRSGIEAIWIQLGWVLGDLAAWLWVHRRVRERSAAVQATSAPGLLATSDDGVVSRPIAIAAGAMTLIFLSAYAAAQLLAGSTTLHTLFGWPMWTGSVIGVAIVTIYCLAGGIRASIWTDAAQSIVMLVAMLILVAHCFARVGGPSALVAQLDKIDPALMALIPDGLAAGFGLYFLGFLVGGAMTVAQPHILVRFIAIDRPESVARARNLYFVWYLMFGAAAVAVGLYARVLLPDLGAGLQGDALTAATESALPQLALELLPSALIGVMLAGLFSATMSTADSQILSCSAAITQDIHPAWSKSYFASKLATLFVAGVALLIALNATTGVFAIVLVAWSALGSTIGPVLLVRLAGRPLSSPVALGMMGAGLATVVVWNLLGWSGSVYDALPGAAAALAVYTLSLA